MSSMAIRSPNAPLGGELRLAERGIVGTAVTDDADDLAAPVDHHQGYALSGKLPDHVQRDRTVSIQRHDARRELHVAREEAQLLPLLGIGEAVLYHQRALVDGRHISCPARTNGGAR